jgi:hypothetical protein
MAERSGEPLASISAQRHLEPAKRTKLVRGDREGFQGPEIGLARSGRIAEDLPRARP